MRFKMAQQTRETGDEALEPVYGPVKPGIHKTERSGRSYGNTTETTETTRTIGTITIMAYDPRQNSLFEF